MSTPGWRPSREQREASLAVAAASTDWAQATNAYASSATVLATALRDLADALSGDPAAPARMHELAALLRANAGRVERQARGQRGAFLALHALIERMERLSAS